MNYFFEHRTHECTVKKINSLEFPAHLHSAVEVALVFSGEAELTLNSTVYSIKAKQASFVFPNQIHGYYDCTKLDGLIFIFAPDILPDLARQFKEQLPNHPIIDIDDDLGRIITEMMSNLDGMSLAEQKGFMQIILCRLLAKADLKQSCYFKDNIVQEILQYCEDHYTEDICLKTLSNKMHVCTSRLSHIFSEKLRVNFCDYINMLRIAKAKKLLAETDKNITEISYLSGFSTIRTFNRAFLRHTGESPSHFRKLK